MGALRKTGTGTDFERNRFLSPTVAVPVLVGVFVLCGVLSMRGDSATFDETAHIGAGVSYLERRDFRLNPEHPPLAKMIAALPLVLLGRTGGDYGSEAWKGVAGAPPRSHANEWTFGFELLNGPRGASTRSDPAIRLFPARLAMIVLGAFLLLAVYGWTREMWGADAALVALLLAATCPTVLAHARLVTTDLPAALGVTATLWGFWRWTRVPSSPRAVVTGVALGAALLFKFNTAMIAPTLVLLAGAAVVAGRVRVRSAAAGVLVMAAVSFAAVWAGYGFRYAAAPDPGYALEWKDLEAETPGVAAPIAFAASHHLLPEGYLYGLAYARTWASARFSFLDGEESTDGWYRYFPEAFLFKTPLAFLALVLWVAAASAWGARGRSLDGWILALPMLALAGSAIVSRFNIGQRHLAPLYPLLCIAASPAAAWLAAWGRRAIAIALLLAGCVMSFALATPGYLSYFNVLAGGTRGGWRHLVDSNVDWGQDLGRLASWMRAHGVGAVDLAYFGTADPRAYGIEFRKVAMFLDTYPERPATRPASGDVVAASVTLLQGVYLDREREFLRDAVGRGFIPRELGLDYLEEAKKLRARGEEIPHAGEWLVRRAALTGEQRATIESGLPACWMDEIRTRLVPIDRVGGSILVYRIP
jgi:hypothetical protein